VGLTRLSDGCIMKMDGYFTMRKEVVNKRRQRAKESWREKLRESKAQE